MKNILVPTDFSTEAHYAFQAALQLAKRMGGRVTLLHAVELPETANFSTYGGPVGGTELPNSTRMPDEVFMMELLKATRRRMEALLAEAAQQAPGVLVNDTVEVGRVNSAIQTVVERQHNDLVVMGAQGHSAAEHFFLGSNTERVIRTAPCPVLAVKQPMGDFDVRTLIFPSNFSGEADQAVAAGLRRTQAWFPQAILQLLYVVSEDDDQVEARQKVEAFARRHALEHYEVVIVVASSPSEGIREYAGHTRDALVVLPTHGRTGLSRLLQASIAEDVATSVFPPVLTFRLT
ncbi:universal stress protein [Hymenobacter humi]